MTDAACLPFHSFHRVSARAREPIWPSKQSLTLGICGQHVWTPSFPGVTLRTVGPDACCVHAARKSERLSASKARESGGAERKTAVARPARQAFFERTLQRDRVESMKMVTSGVSRTLQKRPATATGQSRDHASLCLHKPFRTSAEGFDSAKERRALSRRHHHGGHVPMQFGVWEFCDPSPEALEAFRFVSGMQKATEPANTRMPAAPTSDLMDRAPSQCDQQSCSPPLIKTDPDASASAWTVWHKEALSGSTPLSTWPATTAASNLTNRGRSYAASVQKRSRFPSSRPKPTAAEGDGTRHSSDDTFRKISDWQQLCEGAMKGWSPVASPVWHGNIGPTAQDMLIIRPASASQQRDLHSAVPPRSSEFCEASSARMLNLGGMAYCPQRPKSALAGCRQRSVEMTLHGKTPPISSGHENQRRPNTARRRGTENVSGQPVIDGRKIVIDMSGGNGGEILMQVDDPEGGRGEILRSTSVSGSHSADDDISLQTTTESATPDGQSVSERVPADGRSFHACGGGPGQPR